MNQREFFELCRNCSADAGAASFVDLVLATSDFSAFLLLMRTEGLDALENDERKQNE